MQKDWRERLSIIREALPETKLYLFASANTLDEDAIRFMSTHGVYMICLGLEDPTKEYAKNKKIDEVCLLLKKYGIYIYLSFIVNPLEIIGREKGEEFYSKLTQRFIDLAPEMVCGNFLMPFKGTALYDKYYAYIGKDDYKYYDSKTPFLVANEVVREKMKFFLFWYQWSYYTSEFYNEKVRHFVKEDTLFLRFQELRRQFESSYELLWDKRA
jgi:radical SAM superfamily enzyme YgiQ (UPF0313 family)